MITPETIWLLIFGGSLGFLLGFALATFLQSQEQRYNPLDNIDDDD